MEHVDIGSSPYEEDCVQVSSKGDYLPAMRRECEVFRDQLRRVFGAESEGARLVIKSNPHDFGSYLEVGCKYDPENEVAEAYATKCEEETPARWDGPALIELWVQDGRRSEAEAVARRAAWEGLEAARQRQVLLVIEQLRDIDDDIDGILRRHGLEVG